MSRLTRALDCSSDERQYPGLAWNVRNGFLLGSDHHLERATVLTTWTPLTEGPGHEVISITPLSPGISRTVLGTPSATARAFLRLAQP